MNSSSWLWISLQDYNVFIQSNLGFPILNRKSSFNQINLFSHVKDGENFWVVFAIIFPAFTGLAAGLGLSGDLKDPKKSIPKGTILATAVGLCVYFAVAIKLSMSANVNILGNPDNQLIMPADFPMTAYKLQKI